MLSLIEHCCCKTSVSSVLNRDVKQFGRQHMFDGDEETCWNSNQGSPQWLSVTFERPVHVEQIHVQFQGGFAAKTCTLIDGSDHSAPPLAKFYPEDTNSLQIFAVPSLKKPVKTVKLIFVESSDFYGRITVYKLDMLGVPQ
ncbi:nuclear receptor 2C2-associated protein-like [Oscarella lobularis]|uniref:nuclear receptor 2C2-associated protein-like n=1 Tax=Oscarella lobularis TaxID=121494 RepID=UPI003313C699